MPTSPPHSNGQATPQGEIDEKRTDPNAEAHFLSAIMRGGDRNSEYLQVLHPEMFAEFPKLADVIFDIIETGDGRPDLDTVRSEYGELDDRIQNVRPAPVNIDRFSRRILDAYHHRSWGESFSTLAEMCFRGEDPKEIAEKAESTVTTMTQDAEPSTIHRAGEYVDEVLREVERQEEEGVTGISTGLRDLDRILRGYQDGDLVVIAGRPSMGKTSLALGSCRKASKNGIHTAFISNEMAASRLVTRLLFQEAKVDSTKFNYDETDWKHISRAASTINELPLFLAEEHALTPNDLVSLCRRLVDDYAVELVVFDYLQLLRKPKDAPSYSNKSEWLGEAAHYLKQEAKRLGVPILLISQLNRSVESRGGDKIPQLSDLRQAGEIEEAADVVLFVYRAEQYGISVDDDGNSTEGIAKLIVEKHRNGRTGTATVRFIEHATAFEDLSRRDDDPEHQGGGHPF
jgi:replicative DNA helicase